VYRSDPAAREESPPAHAVTEEKANGDRDADLTIVLPRLRFDGRDGQAKRSTKD